MRFKLWSWVFIGFFFAALHTMGMAQAVTTQVADTIYHADGTTAGGTVLIAWPAFTAGNGAQVPAGNTSAVIGAGGALSVNLIPNADAIPIGSYYTVTYHLDDNSVTRQYWVVPQSATPVHLAAIVSTVLPTSVAMQTVTKSYVDTAIANIAGGHPVDTSTLVQKAGDTMSGPLALSADPVAPLQAATKHYVDTAVASAPGGSGLSGQTVNSVPLATSTTASATSSHFFESGGASGVFNPFAMYSSAPTCNQPGQTFIQYACNYMHISDNGTTSDIGHNLTGFNMTMNSWGPGGGFHLGGAAAENRVTTVYGGSNSGALVSASIRNAHYNNTSGFGAGDFQGSNEVFYCVAGVLYGSDEGCQGHRLKVGELDGEWNSVITGGTNTQPTFTTAGGCSSLENFACAPAPGTTMLDTSVVRASGNVTSPPSTTALGLGWLSQSSTSFSPPASTAWGYATGINISPSADTTWDAPVSQTFTLQGGAGTFASGDHACMMGSNFTEQNVISAVSGTSPTQTITMPLVMPEADVAIFKGDCMYMAFDADAAQDVWYALPTVSIDGANIVYTYANYGQNRASLIPADGVTWAKFDGGAASGVHLYAGARVTKVATTDPVGPNPFSPANLQVFLEPNSAFSSGDNLLNAHFNAQQITGVDLETFDDMAPSDAAHARGVVSTLLGKGISLHARAFYGVNGNPTSYYKSFGGPLTEPHFIVADGPFNDFFTGNYTPLTSIFSYSNHHPGQTSYNILSDPTWGILSLDNTSTLHWNADFNAHGSVIAQTGLLLGGLGTITGPGDGSGNQAGLELQFKNSTPPSFLTPCKLLATTTTDLCVTSQGSSRVVGGGDYSVTADRGLQVNDLTVNGSVKGDGGAGGGPAVLSIVPTNAGAGNYTWGISVFDPNVVVGQHIVANFAGKGIATSDCGYWGFLYGGSEPADKITQGWCGIGDVTTLDTSGNTTQTGNLGLNSGKVLSWNSDTGLSRSSAGVVDIGNGTAGDASGTIKAALYTGPATAPTGSCSAAGWAFSQDGHVSFCDGSAWVLKM